MPALPWLRCAALLGALTSTSALTTGAELPATATGPPARTAIPAADSLSVARIFMEVALSPNGRYVAAVEGQSSPPGGDPVIRELVIRSADGHRQVSVALPCGNVKGCWPASPAWTPDSRLLSFALRDPQTHARSLYQVSAEGTELTRLLAFSGTIQSLRYARNGQLAMLAVENAAKEVGAREAGETLTDSDGPIPEQRIAVLEHDGLHWISPPDMFVYEYDWMADGRGFVGTAAPGDGDRNWWVAKLYAYDRNGSVPDGFAPNGSAPRLLYAPASVQQQLASPRVSRDGKRVAFIAGLMSDFGATGGDLYTVPLSGGAATLVTRELPATVTAVHWACRDHLLATVLSRTDAQIVDFGNGSSAASGELLWQGPEMLGGPRLFSLAECAWPGTTLTHQAMAVTHQSFNDPPEIELGTVGKWHDLTRVNAGLTTRYPVQSLSWQSDQFQVQGWLILPEPATPKPPLITVVHGGPSGANEPRFIGAGAWRALLSHGYALFLPNPRGSFGAGEAFVRANVRDFGHGDLRDILSGVDAVAALGLTNADRIGIMGRSYGGFMAMWSVTQTDRFKAAVAGAGISNWQSYYGENGIDAWMIPFFGASVYDDPAVYARSSAINFIRQAHTPTFAYVGAADIECPAPQTLEFGHALKVLGTPSSTIIYPDEGHAIHDPQHLADIDARTVSWFDRYLR